MGIVSTPMTQPNTQQPKAFEKYGYHEQQEQPTLEVEDIVDSTGKFSNQQPALLILTPTPLTVIRRLSVPSSNPSHWHTR